MIKLKDVEEEKLNTLMPIPLKTESKLKLLILMLTEPEVLLNLVLITKVKLYSQTKVLDSLLKMIPML